MSGAVSVGVAAFAIAGAVATEFATFAVIGAVGATVGAIGAVTKSKELQIAGAAIGAVGAIGGIASAAGVFGTGGTIFGGAEAGAAGLAGGGSWADQAFAATQGASSWADTALAAGGGIDAEIAQWSSYGAQAPAAGAGAGSHMIDTIAATVEPPVAAAGSPQPVAAQGTDARLVGQNDPMLTRAVQNEPVVDVSLGAPRTPSVPGMDASGRAPYGVPEAPTVTGEVSVAPGAEANASRFGAGKGPMGPSGGSVSPTDSFWKDIWDFARSNKYMTGGLIQGAASFLTGAADPRTPAQIQKMNAEAAAYRAAGARSTAEADLINQRLSNMRGPVPVARRVTGAPQGNGLINSPTVTGAPA